MIEIRGKYNTAKVFTGNIEPSASAQILELCNQPFVEGSLIRIMPDVHTGAGCTIGTTMTIKDKVVPNLVGVDVGCGMTVAFIDTGGADKTLDSKGDRRLSMYSREQRMKAIELYIKYGKSAADVIRECFLQ